MVSHLTTGIGRPVLAEMISQLAILSHLSTKKTCHARGIGRPVLAEIVAKSCFLSHLSA
jgi:hypothetical protein